jgi:hypothetical protein
MDDVVLAFSDQPLSGGVAAREYGDRCQMHHRDGTRRNRLHLAATVGLLLLSACTGGNAAEPGPTDDSSPPATPTATQAPADTVLSLHSGDHRTLHGRQTAHNCQIRPHRPSRPPDFVKVGSVPSVCRARASRSPGPEPSPTPSLPPASIPA